MIQIKLLFAISFQLKGAYTKYSDYEVTEIKQLNADDFIIQHTGLKSFN